ncbi:hypothetical protein HELRODRAFT_169362 [Helobdella robusta]|uniref:Sushi domain-containing protein n=1 Tax=Helobdella robusta TaxID=6412 RepID=T1F1U5_HELRO|nr:hypothetical protein HELRODRAFT_169362 [Helobdella robusta]ESO08504.1 hypothetical protein HELRODRAFT_169362 [Helobdella robusta]
MTTATSNSNLDSNVPTINNGFLVLHPYFQYFHPSDPYVIHDDATTKSCPWILETDPGRKFNVTWRVPSSTLLLMDGSDLVPLNDDLGIGNHQHPNYSPIQPQHQQHLLPPPSSSTSSATYCGYAWKFVDGEEEMFYAACVSGVKKPQMRFFLSKTNRLEVHYTGSSQKREHARLPLLEFKVVGCSHYKPPDGTFTNGHEDNMNVVCNTSGQVWHVTCQDGIWKGTVGSCNGGNQARENAAVHIKPSAMPRLEMKLDRGVITAVLVGILLGGTFGAMLLLGIFILKRRESSNRNRLQHKSSSNKANNNKTTTTNFNETIYNTPPMNQHHVHPDYQLHRQQQLQMHPHKPQQPQYRQMSNNSLNRNTDREHLQQLHISADVISACHRCYDDHPPPSYSLDQQTTCTCLANQQSPTCCYSDQTKLISFTGTSPEISCCHRNSKNDLTAEGSLVLTNMADRTPGHVIDDDIMEGGKSTTLSRGSLRKFSKNEYLAVKSDEVDD